MRLASPSPYTALNFRHSLDAKDEAGVAKNKNLSYSLDMGNLEKSQIEPVEPGYGQEPEIDLDKVAIEYAEKVRASLAEQKENLTEGELKESQMAIHLSRINPMELTHEDLIIYDKFMKGNLEEGELKEYREHLRKYFDEIKEEKNKEGEDFNFLNIRSHSRENFLAMIWTLFQDKKIDEKLEKMKKNTQDGIVSDDESVSVNEIV